MKTETTLQKCLQKNLFIYFCILPFLLQAQASQKTDSAWVDSVVHSLTTEEKIAQLLVIRAYSDRDSIYNDSLTRLITCWNVGGVCFFKGTPFRQVTLINRWQSIAKTPLLIAIDAEWGVGMRLDSAFSFPKPMTLGAMVSDSLIYRMARNIAKDCHRIGVHINFAPVADINNNPLNPVINMRSFGEDKTAVARKSILFMKGLQEEGIIATAKHFPGHGDTDTDSHLSLPVINKSQESLDSLELFPFRELIRAGVQSVMVAHLYIPAYDSGNNIPATLSYNIITGLLKEKLGFKGLVITDALDMQGVTKYFKPGEIELKALLAGNDILLLPQNVEAAVNRIKLAVDSGVISQEMIDQKCRRILQLKASSGLMKKQNISPENLFEDLNPFTYTILNDELYGNAQTLVRNQRQIIPVKFLDRKKIAHLSLGDTTRSGFEEMLNNYAPADHFRLPSAFPSSTIDSVLRQLKPYNMVIISLHSPTSLPSKRFGVTQEELAMIDSCCLNKDVILCIFGSPYILNLLDRERLPEGILVAYEDNSTTQILAAETVLGGFSVSGRLPVTGSADFPLGTGIPTEKSRFQYIPPEEIGIPGEMLSRIDSIVSAGINAKAFPGCQVLFGKDGNVFYRKAFGHPQYHDSAMVRNDDLYDLASLTKIAATTLALMKLYEEGKLYFDDPLGKYLPMAKGTNKEKLILRDILTHQAGLQPWIPFYEKTMKNGNPDPTLYKKEYSPEFSVPVADSLFLARNYRDSIFKSILDSPLLPVKEYKYSDLGFYLLRIVIEKLTGQPFEKYLDDQFYRPLGLTTMTFNPAGRFSLLRIIPTENDTFFRRQLIHGYVHDPGAAMLGGISGHAGLFSDANDLAVILQLLMNGGEYGGRQYLLPSTIKEFTRVQFPGKGNRRGLGFDKPPATFTPDGPVCRSASPASFGHSGFTGTYIWADPENNLVYVFLSNRVNPNASNQKIISMNIRTAIHQAMYDILEQVKK